MCHQSVGLVARHIEEAGIPTICAVLAHDIASLVKMPRAAFLDFPMGHTMGRPGNSEEQRTILHAVLEAAVRISNPGEIVDLPFQWDESGSRAWEDKLRTFYLQHELTGGEGGHP